MHLFTFTTMVLLLHLFQCFRMAEETTMELTEADISGAVLKEPLESHAIPALRWWLLCHGIRVPTSWKKPKLIDR